MTFRQHIARALRKWADLFDPRVAPHDRLTVTLECDTTEFMKSCDAAIAKAREVAAALKDFA